ncbi:MAG TPA: hypothetical protein VM737_08060 [Gemmatimonadota bacterium]|nr:hypothetical protein [Gemmatimonadota bacterium]
MDRGSFQILGVLSGFKIDVFVPGTELDRRQIADRRRVSAVADLEAAFAPPEELIVHKMAFYQEGGPEKHLRDIASIWRSRETRSTAAGSPAGPNGWA